MALLTIVVAMPAMALGQSRTDLSERSESIRHHHGAIQEIHRERGEPLLAAIFIKNRARTVDDQKTRVFEDMLIGEITDVGMRVVSHEDSVTALRRFLQAEEERERRTVDDRSRVHDENRLMSQAVDRVFEDSASALRLAQSMQVDYLVIGSITSYGTSSQRVNRDDLSLDRTVVTHRLRTMFKVLDIAKGGSETAGNTVSERRIQQSNDAIGELKIETMLDDLLADASMQIGAQLGRRIAAGRIRERAPDADMVEFVITCGMQDMIVPEIIRDDDGKYVMIGNTYQLQAMAVTVELNGVVVGSAPGSFEAHPGLHRLRLTREGFSPWERMINLVPRANNEPFSLDVALQLDAAGYQRWREMMTAIDDLKKNQALTDAQVKLAEGVAEMFRNSQIRIDPSTMNIDNRQRSVWPY